MKQCFREPSRNSRRTDADKFNDTHEIMFIYLIRWVYCRNSYRVYYYIVLIVVILLYAFYMR